MGKLRFREVKQLTQGRRASEVLELEVTWTAPWATAEVEGGCWMPPGLWPF